MTMTPAEIEEVGLLREKLAEYARSDSRREEAETALRQSEERYRRLFEAAKDGILLLDFDTGMITQANPFVVGLVGYSRKELLTKHLWDVVPFKDIVASKEAFLILQRRGYVRFEDKPLQTRAGQKAEVEFVSNVYDAGGTKIIQCNIRDITQRKKAEAALRRMASMVESSTDAIIDLSLDGAILTWNRGAQTLLGYSPEEAIGKNITMLTAEDLKDKISAAFELLRRGQNGGQVETQYNAKDGRLLDVSVTLSPVKDAAGTTVGASVIARDISRRKRAEAELEQSNLQLRHSQKMDTAGRLAGGIAHDFNNLLMAILGYSELLMKRLSPDDPRRSDVEEIRKAGERAASLTRQLLAFSRKQVLQLKVLDLNAVAADMENMLRRLIGEDIELRLVTPPDPALVNADTGLLEQVFLNLVVNARDAITQGGKITFEIGLNSYAEESIGHQYETIPPGDYIVLSVTDTGSGMSKEIQAHLFEPFFTTKAQGKGTGLGLSTLYGIVKQLGGYVGVYSELGKGSLFKVYLPRLKESAERAGPAPPEVPARGCTGTILLVEDDEQLRALTRRFLLEAGFTVLEAAGGEEALALCKDRPHVIDLMLTDVIMPKMNGPELAAQATARLPGIKVVFMSGFTDHVLLADGRLTLDNAFLQKPFTAAALVTTVQRVLAPAPAAAAAGVH